MDTHALTLPAPETSALAESVRVDIMQPASLATIMPEGRIKGVGWVGGASLVTSVEVLVAPGAMHAAPAPFVPLGNARLGVSAEDVAMMTGQAPSGAGTGFAFNVPVPQLPLGPVTLRVRSRGPAGTYVKDLVLRLKAPAPNAEPVAVLPSPVLAPTPDPDAIKFHLDAPACRNGFAIEPVSGFLSLVGWALGRHGIDKIEVFVDGVSQGHAHQGVRREDLMTAFPDFDAARAGFAMMLPPQVMKPGVRAVRIDICDKAGNIKEISFSVNAEAAATGPGPWLLRSKMPQADIDLLHAMLGPSGRAMAWTVVIALPDDRAFTLKALHETLASLRWQAHENWSLVLLAPPGSTVSADGLASVSARLQSLPTELRTRIRLLAPEPARRLSSLGDGFLVVLAPGDRLGEDALLELAVAATLEPNAAFLYSDERRIDPMDGTEKAFFKPDFSPDLLLSTNYIGRLWAASSALLARSGLTEADLRRHGLYDAVLRLTEQADGIHHVARVLCARGKGSGDTPGLERAALARALRRRGICGRLLPGPVRGTWRLQRDIPAEILDARPAAGLRQHGLVSIIIPTIAARGFIKAAIDSIRANTAWPAYEIICLDNIPPDADADHQVWKRWIADNADYTIEIAEAFNWSRFNNVGVKAARGEFLLFLNDDIEVHHPHWLHGLVEHAQRPEVGVVGPQLLYADGRVQHAGVFLARRAARHAFRLYPRDAPGPFGLALTQRDVMSVTGACMMMRRAVFDAVGGFDEAHAIVNNDLDFNLRVRAAGFSVIYTPAVSLTHHEAVSRAKLSDVFDSQKFAEAWGDLFLRGDRFFSRHFSPDYDDYLPDTEPVRCFTAGNPLVARHKIRRILAIKVDHIGDFVTAFPAFRRIKAHFPGAELTVLAAKASLALTGLEPAIDHIIEFNFYHARSEKGQRGHTKQALAALRAQLAPMAFDLGIDLRRQPDTRPILQASGARWLAGFDSGQKFNWLDFAVEFEGDVALSAKHSHASRSLVTLVDAVAVQCEPDRQLVAQPIAKATARDTLSRLLGRPVVGKEGQPLVCVHTGAGALNKQWPAASFAGLIDLLAGQAGAAILMIGTPEEAAFASTVIGLLRRPAAVTSLVSKTGLHDLPAVLGSADLYVGNDSGPKHLAAALGVPTIGIHSGSVDAGEWGAVGPHALTIRRDMTCSPCYLARASDCHRGLFCLSGIRVSDVFEACLRMLNINSIVN